MTTSKFRYIHSRRACCPVAQKNDEFRILAYTLKICLLPCCPDLWQIQNFGIHSRNHHVALLPRIMTNSKFWHRRSKPPCCPVAQTNDKFKNLAYTFKICLLPCCPGEWQLQNFDIYIREEHVALLPRKTTNSEFWHRRSKPACCPVAQTNDQFNNLAYTFKICLLPCCPGEWRLQKNRYIHPRRACCPVAQNNDELRILA